MTREEFKKEITNRFKNTDSGSGNMTQRELILLQIATDIYYKQINISVDSVSISVFCPLMNRGNN